MSKYLAVAPRPAYVVTDLSDEDDSDIDVEVDDLADKKPARKRQRLDHLSPEEKLQRRKLKNRVAAQTARDRKKARMDDLEAAVKRSEREVSAFFFGYFAWTIYHSINLCEDGRLFLLNFRLDL